MILDMEFFYGLDQEAIDKVLFYPSGCFEWDRIVAFMTVRGALTEFEAALLMSYPINNRASKDEIFWLMELYIDRSLRGFHPIEVEVTYGGFWHE